MLRGSSASIKAIHGSIRVGFMPNPEPTRQNQVGKKMHLPPTCRSNRVRRFRPPTGGGRVGWSHRSENMTGKR